MGYSHILACALTALLAPAAPASALAQQAEVTSLSGEKLEAARAAIQRAAKATKDCLYLEASFSQHQASLLLAEPLKSAGQIQIRTKPACMVLRFSEPRKVLIRSDAVSHVVYDPSKAAAERYVFESNEIAKAIASFFSPDIEKTERHFFFVELTALKDALELRMVPRDEVTRKMLPELRVRFRGKDGVPDSIAYVNRDAERTTLTMSDLRLLKDVKKLQQPFDFKIPEGVTVVVHKVAAPKPAKQDKSKPAGDLK